MGGFIKIDRKITEWEWYGDVNTKSVFIHCLVRANWKDGRFLGVAIPRGSFATSVKNLAEEVGISVRQTRTALDKLKMTNSLSIKRHSKFSIITVVSYDKYQTDDKQNVNQMTNDRQTECQSEVNQMTTIEEYKEYKEIKKNTLSRGESKQARFVPPTVEEVSRYCQERQNGITGEEFCAFYESKDWMIGKNRMKNWKAAVRTWESKRGFSYQQNKPHEENGQLKRVLQ